MFRERLPILVLCLAFGVAMGLPRLASADEAHQVGLAIRFEEGRVVTQCIAFEGDAISGSDLLARSGLNLAIDSSRGLGITVCKIERLGCNYPAQACFCQCMGGGNCRYWNYYYRDPDQDDWTYSPLGALLRKSQPGSVEAWVWGDGRTPPDASLTFDAICRPATATPAPTRPAPAPAAASSAAPPTATLGAPTLPPQTPPLVSGAVSPTPAAATPLADSASLSIYWPFGVLLLLVVGVLAYLRLGRK